jgi:predicted MFS family arabinose efflux permease
MEKIEPQIAVWTSSPVPSGGMTHADPRVNRAGAVAGAGKFLFMIALSQFIVANDFCSLSVSLSTLSRALVVPPNILQWVVSGCTLAFGGFLVLGGRLCDLFPQRNCFIVGIAMSCGGALLSATAPDIGTVIAGRVLVGSGGALVNPAILSLTVNYFAAGAQRNKGLSMFAVAQSVGAVFGLVMGGVISTHIGWRGIFYVDFTLALIALLAAWWCLPILARPRVALRVDVLGALLITATCALLVYSLSSIGGSGWLSSKVLVAGGVSVVALVLFIIVEKTRSAPLVPLSLFRRPNFSASVFVSFCSNASSASLLILLAMFLEKRAHLTAQQVGFVDLPMALASVLGGILVPKMLNRISPRAAMAIGVGVFVFIMLGMTQLSPTNPAPFALLVLLFFPICQMGAIIASMAEATGTAPDEQRGVASSILLAANQISVAFGLAIIASALRPSIAGGPENFVNAFAAGAGLPALGLLVALVAVKGRYGQAGASHH